MLVVRTCKCEAENLHEACAASDENVLYVGPRWELCCAFENGGAVNNGGPCRINFFFCFNERRGDIPLAWSPLIALGDIVQ